MAVGGNRAMAARELSADIKQCGDEERPPYAPPRSQHDSDGGGSD